MGTTYNIFISHSWTYGDAYRRLVSLLESRPYFSFRNFSVPKDDRILTRGTDREQELYDAIKRKIQLCHCVLILAGVYSTHSKWINKEIQICQAEFTIRKPVIAVQPWGSQKTSSVVKEVADKLVAWNTDSIITAIKELCG